MSAWSERPSNATTSQAPDSPESPQRSQSYPKSVRLLCPAEFRTVYDQGRRYTCPYFAAFILRRADESGCRFGFTLPRAVGKAVFRNRIRRRLREIIRLSLDRFPENISVVFNPRRLSHDAPRERLSQEVERLIAFLSR